MHVFKLSPGSLPALGPHRAREGWEVCVDGEWLWLRFPATGLAAASDLPGRERFKLDEDGRLIPHGGTLPVGRPPEGPWQGLADYVEVARPPAVLPGRPPDRVAVALQRSCKVVPPMALLARLEDLRFWAERASRLRFGRLKFAAAADGRVMVVGTPLPPVPGVSYYLEDALALPCGWELAAPLTVPWVEKAISAAPDTLIVLHPEAPAAHIRQEAFVPLSLAAIRRTAAALAGA